MNDLYSCDAVKELGMTPAEFDLLLNAYVLGRRLGQWSKGSAPAPTSTVRRVGKPLLWGSDLSAVRRARKVARYSRASNRRR